MKMYELTNHLGNVLVTVGDRKRQHSGDGTSIDYYTADVRSAQHYYPFGPDSYRETMPGIPGRESAPDEMPVLPDSLMIEDSYESGVGGWTVYSNLSCNR